MKINSFEYSQMQKERIHKTKPWLKSTGATTLEGKEKSKMNALKCDLHIHLLLKESRELFKQSKELHKTILI